MQGAAPSRDSAPEENLGIVVAWLEPLVWACRRAEPREVGTESAAKRRPGLG